jgi:hypothetical protein
MYVNVINGYYFNLLKGGHVDIIMGVKENTVPTKSNVL